MIWGKTTTQSLIDLKTPKIWYAWRPIKLDDGRWAWLENITKQYEFWRDGQGYCYYELKKHDEELETKIGEKI